MYKSLKIIIFLLVIDTYSYSQIYHTNSQHMIGIFYSQSSHRNICGKSYQYFINSNISIKISLCFENLLFNNSNNQSLLIKPEFLFTHYSDGKYLFFNVKSGFLSGLETLNATSNNQQRKYFCFGTLIGETLEFYISPKTKFEFEVEERAIKTRLKLTFIPYFTFGTYFKFN